MYIPPMPVAIITNDVSMYDRWIGDSNWMHSVIWWRIEQGVYLMPRDKRPVK